MKEFLIYFALILVLNNICFSQHDFRKGYIITNNKDTIYGLIDYSNPSKNSEYCSFRKDSLSDVIEYSPENLRAYNFLNNNYYISKIVQIGETKRIFFLEYLLHGVINLYYLKNNDKDYYFIEKNDSIYELSNEKRTVYIDGQPFEKTEHRYIGVLKSIMKDADSISNEIEKTEFKHTSLIKLTKDYHDKVCNGEKCIVYYKKQKFLNSTKWRINYGISLESIWSEIKMTSQIENNYSDALITNGYNKFVLNETNASFVSQRKSLLPVLFVNINRNSRTSLQIAVEYQIIKYSLIELKELKIPILFSYEFFYYKNPKPFVSIGVVPNFNIKSITQGLYFNYGSLENSYGDYLNHTDIFNQQIFHDSGLNLIFGCGINYSLSAKRRFKLEIRDEIGGNNYLYNLAGGAEISSNMQLNNVSLLISYFLN